VTKRAARGIRVDGHSRELLDERTFAAGVYAHYEHLPGTIVSEGIREHEGKMKSYILGKDAISPLFIKRRVLANFRESLPFDSI